MTQYEMFALNKQEREKEKSKGISKLYQSVVPVDHTQLFVKANQKEANIDPDLDPGRITLHTIKPSPPSLNPYEHTINSNFQQDHKTGMPKITFKTRAFYE